VCPVLDARDQAAARRPSEEGGRRLPAFIRDGATPSKGEAPRWVAIYLRAVLNGAARSKHDGLWTVRSDLEVSFEPIGPRSGLRSERSPK
jgi:hypothetical protein